MSHTASGLTPGPFGQPNPYGAPAAPQAASPGTVAEIFKREARRGGRLVLSVRCVRRGDGFIVECDTYSVSASPDAGPKRRAFAFRELPGAEQFVSETLRALEYLDCHVS